MQTVGGYIVTIIVLMVYLTIGSWMETKHFAFGHETGVIIVIGICISFIIKSTDDPELRFLEWDNDLFFLCLLPLIIFTTGYNIRRRKFFANFINISKFGIVGTVLTFVFFFLMNWALFKFCTLWKYDPRTEEWLTWKLDIYSIAYYCAILTGSDIIAAVTLVKVDEQPTLFSIILGEGLANDVVVIILYQSMEQIAEELDFDPVKAPFQIFGKFL